MSRPVNDTKRDRHRNIMMMLCKYLPIAVTTIGYLNLVFFVHMNELLHNKPNKQLLVYKRDKISS